MRIDRETVGRSVDGKLQRAREHVSELEREAEEFVRTSLETKRTVENGGCRHVVSWTKYSEPPDRLGLIIGDAAHNIRSALDHLVFALATAGAKEHGIELTEDDKRRLQYPMARTGKEFRVNQRRSLKCVPEDVVDYIKGRQPFTIQPSAPESHFLASLSWLDNTDKHRTLVPFVATPWVGRLNWPKELINLASGGPVPHSGEPYPPVQKVGAEIFHFDLPRPYTAKELPISLGFVVSISANRQSAGAVSFLSNLITQVESLIDDIYRGAKVQGSLIFYPG